MQFKINLKDIDGVKAFCPLILGFESDMDLSIDHYTVDAKSILGVLSLNINKDLLMTIHEKAEGETIKIMDLMRENGFLVEAQIY